mmetsp:Transcript_4964/g.11934  ORF Transcript_4964/g.11934 Transcript_4964/m.11934 type:complete len:288 (+) Transcript_4964:223-1086(+)
MTAQRNSILFRVSVPVLSVKMYSTWPRSSLICELFTRIGPFFGSMRSQSDSMRYCWSRFTTSEVTTREIGTNCARTMNQEKNRSTASRPAPPESMRYHAFFRPVNQTAEKIAPIRHSTDWRIIICHSSRVTFCMICERFSRTPTSPSFLALRRIFVCFPQYTTSAWTQVVFFSFVSRRSRLSPERRTRFPCDVTKNPSNCSSSFRGCSTSMIPSRSPRRSFPGPSIARSSACASLIFRFVSPSSEAVSTKQWPALCAELRSRQSEGKLSPARTRMMSPTARSPDLLK